MHSLAALSYRQLKSTLPLQISADVGCIKKKVFAALRENSMIAFLNGCMDNEVVPKFLIERIPNSQRKVQAKFNSFCSDVLSTELARRIECSTNLSKMIQSERSKFSSYTLSTIDAIVHHFTKHEKDKLEQKYNNQINSLIIHKEARTFKTTFDTNKIINLTNKVLSKSEIDTLRLGMNMTWPSKIDKLQIQVSFENLYDRLSKNSSITPSELGNVKTHLKSHYLKIMKNHEKVTNTTKSHVKNLVSLSKEKNIYFSKFDKGNGVCLENRDTYVRKMKDILSN